MPALDPCLQSPFSDVLLRIANDARATARQLRKGPSEVDWIENFHALVAEDLAADLQHRLRGDGIALSASVGTALVHGKFSGAANVGSWILADRAAWPD
jgi:hypothetical protein